MKKKIYIQILGVIACLAVVAMHVNGCFWQFSYDRYWITANIIECICYFAVPIFFMISGATLLNYRKRYTTAVFFKKRWLNHKFCGISDSSRSSVGSYRIASERNIRHQDIRIPVCEES